MLQQEVVKYWIPAVRRINGNFHVTVKACEELDMLLGTNEYCVFHTPKKVEYNWNKPLPEDMKKLLVMLAGSHGKTILKMYRIRKGLE